MNSVDVDAFNTYDSAIKDAAKIVADKFDLSQQWLNDDFKKTASYSPKLGSIQDITKLSVMCWKLELSEENI